MFEVTALTRVDPTKNEEDWPLLHLDEASVYIYKRGQEDQLVSLYEASLLGPFRVRGRLRKVSKAQNNLSKLLPSFSISALS